MVIETYNQFIQFDRNSQDNKKFDCGVQKLDNYIHLNTPLYILYN